MDVVVNVTVGKSKQAPRVYRFHHVTNLSRLHERLLREPEIGHGCFYRVRPDGESYPIPFSEYSQPYVEHPDGLYYSVYDEATLEQQTQLTTAIRTGDLATVQQLVPNTFDVNLITPYDGSLLHRAIVHGQVPIVEYLLRRGADVNLNDGRFIPLSDAVRTRNLPIVRLLVDNGAEINIERPDSTTILNDAISSQSLPIIDFLLRSGADFELADQGWKPIHIAVDAENLEVVKMLVEAGANINAQIDNTQWDDTSLSTPLMIAAMNGYFDIAIYLLQHGADTEIYNALGMTAEDIAGDGGYNNIIGLIHEQKESLIKEPEF